jgi:hypothetical protein
MQLREKEGGEKPSGALILLTAWEKEFGSGQGPEKNDPATELPNPQRFLYRRPPKARITVRVFTARGPRFRIVITVGPSSRTARSCVAKALSFGANSIPTTILRRSISATKAPSGLVMQHHIL